MQREINGGARVCMCVTGNNRDQKKQRQFNMKIISFFTARESTQQRTKSTYIFE